MKSCHYNNGVLQFMLEGPRPWTIFCFTGYTKIKYLNRNFCIGQLPKHIAKSVLVCARSRSKMLPKTSNKEVCQAS